jgi:hypothetical protein
MNGETAKIEIFKPFGEGFEWMKRILFQPFDFKKWLVLGFAAFIGGNWGGGAGFRNYNRDAFKGAAAQGRHPHFSDFWPWGSVALIIAVVVFLALVLVITWIFCRGRFIFTDCVVKNRAAIVAPWREFRREGNSFFLFSIAVFFIAVLIIVVLVLIFILPFGIFAHGKAHHEIGVGVVVGICCAVLFWFVLASFFGLLTHFMVPVMYRQRCTALPAFVQVTRLILNHLGVFILLILFSIVLFMAFVVISMMVTCLTCCVGGLPYISSVILLPVLVFFAAFKLYFLRQFGSEFDVWNGMPPSLDAGPAPPEPPAPPIEPTLPPAIPPAEGLPPIQT